MNLVRRPTPSLRWLLAALVVMLPAAWVRGEWGFWAALPLYLVFVGLLAAAFLRRPSE